MEEYTENLPIAGARDYLKVEVKIFCLPLSADAINQGKMIISYHNSLAEKSHIAISFLIMFELAKAYYKKLVPEIREDEWNALQEKLTIQQVKKGAFLIRDNEICRQVSFINKGLVRMYYLVDGKEICMGFVAENEYVSQYDSFLTHQPSSGNIDALEDCEFVNLSFDDMQHIYLSYPVFEKIGRKIAEMLFLMISSHTTRLLTLSPEERYKSLIEYQPFIIQRVPQYMIASFIGITPEHLSRLRKKMTGK